MYEALFHTVPPNPLVFTIFKKKLEFPQRNWKGFRKSIELLAGGRPNKENFY